MKLTAQPVKDEACLDGWVGGTPRKHRDTLTFARFFDKG
jgi:hypothetical protein